MLACTLETRARFLGSASSIFILAFALKKEGHLRPDCRCNR